MRLRYFAIALSLLFMSVGALFAIQARKPKDNIDSDFEPKHPVTSKLEEIANEHQSKPAKDFSLKDTNGKTHTLKDLAAGKPLFVYFILYQCPCSVSAEPLFQALAQHQKGKTNFVGIIASGMDEAKRWVASMRTPYPVLADPNQTTMESYGAVSSAFSALVKPDGTIEKMWPGYSIDILTDINKTMDRVAGSTPTTFDTEYAPLKGTAGCTFDWVGKVKA